MRAPHITIPTSLASAVLASTFFLASPATAAPGCDWSAPVRLSGSDTAALPSVASGRPGQPAISFYRFGDDVRALNSDGRTSTDLGTASSQPTPSMRPQLIATDQNSRGQAVAVFALTAGKEGRIYAALRNANGKWQPRVLLTQQGAFGFYPQVAIDEAGRSLAVWTQNTSTGGTYIVGRAVNAKGATGKLFRLGNGESENPMVAMGGAGTIAVAWDEVGATTNPVWSSISTDGGREWSEASRVSAANVSTDNKAIDVAASGRIGLVWDQEQGGDSQAIQVVAASTKRDNSWIDPVALSRGEHLSLNGGIATGGTNRFTVAWITSPTNGAAGRNVLKVASGLAIDSLSTPKRIDVTTDAAELQRPHVAVNARGVAAVVWERAWSDADPRDGTVAGLMAAVRTEGRWQTAQRIRGWRANPAYSRVGIDTAGGVTVAWDQQDGGSNSVAFAQCAAGPVG
jgi:hypothetical protein